MTVIMAFIRENDYLDLGRRNNIWEDKDGLCICRDMDEGRNQ